MTDAAVCATCGHQWPWGQDGSHSCVGNLIEERDSLQSQLSEAMAQREKFQNLFLLAMDYIAASPVDPDINKEQVDVWLRMQNSGANYEAARLRQQAKED